MSFITGTKTSSIGEDGYEELPSFSINGVASKPFRHKSKEDIWYEGKGSSPVCPLCNASLYATTLYLSHVGEQVQSNEMSDTDKSSLHTQHPVCIIQTSSPPTLRPSSFSNDGHIYGEECSVSGTFAVLTRDDTTYRMLAATCFKLDYIPCFQPSLRGTTDNRKESESEHERLKHVDFSGIRRNKREKRALRKIRRWIEDGCGHRECLPNYVDELLDPDRQTLPSRLLRLDKVGVSVSVCLVDTDGILSWDTNSEYATLSHRWSSSVESVKLLTTNHSRYSSGVPIHELPTTLQDAIEVALTLDMKYLWIDALCIIQDSENDWNREAPRMFMIYSRGKFNIAATGAVDGNESLFIQNDIFTSTTVQIAWDIPGLPKGEWIPLANNGIDADIGDYRDFVTNGPLNRRGWVLQERALARRTIHFARDQIWWECRREVHNESNLSSLKMGDRSQIVDSDWQNLVRRYSDTDLTFASDRLVAFAGVAEAFAAQSRYRPEDYAAGMWKQRLPEDLFWFRVSDPRSKIDTYTAPSWSWASIKTQVVFRRPWIPINGVIIENKSFSLLQISTFLATRSPFGQVRGGVMRCLGLIHHIVYRYSMAPGNSTLDVCGITYTEDVSVSNVTTLAILQNDDGRCWTFFANLSDSSGFSINKDLTAFFVPVMFKKTPGNAYDGPFFWSEKACNVLYGLLIQKADDPGYFRRIGVLLLKSYGDTVIFPSCWDENSDFPDDPHFIRRTDGLYEFTIV